jgi:hypothetical protein
LVVKIELHVNNNAVRTVPDEEANPGGGGRFFHLIVVIRLCFTSIVTDSHRPSHLCRSRGGGHE